MWQLIPLEGVEQFIPFRTLAYACSALSLDAWQTGDSAWWIRALSFRLQQNAAAEPRRGKGPGTGAGEL